MGLIEFLALLVSAIILTLLFMMIGEKVISIAFHENMTPFIRIVGSLVFAIVILTTLLIALEKTSVLSLFLLSGAIILYNKYWLGHFSGERAE